MPGKRAEAERRACACPRNVANTQVAASRGRTFSPMHAALYSHVVPPLRRGHHRPPPDLVLRERPAAEAQEVEAHRERPHRARLRHRRLLQHSALPEGRSTQHVRRREHGRLHAAVRRMKVALLRLIGAPAIACLNTCIETTYAGGSRRLLRRDVPYAPTHTSVSAGVCGSVSAWRSSTMPAWNECTRVRMQHARPVLQVPRHAYPQNAPHDC